MVVAAILRDARNERAPQDEVGDIFNLSYFFSENSVGVLPVTCRKACENAGTLA
jgi:hypothetical protein